MSRSLAILYNKLPDPLIRNARRPAETGGGIHTAPLHTFQHELAKGYLQLTPRVLTNEAMELPSQVMNR
jgi:hypothetical protein